MGGVGPSDDMFSEKSFSSYDSMDLSESWFFSKDINEVIAQSTALSKTL